MVNQVDSSEASGGTRQRRKRAGWTIRITPTGILILALINLLILGGWAYGISRVMTKSGFPESLFPYHPSDTPTLETRTSNPPTTTRTVSPTSSSTVQSTDSPTPIPISGNPQPLGTLAMNQGLIILALDEGGNTHLFAYQPEEIGAGQPMQLTRLTYGPWDDISPAISLDGKSIAFASNRNGYWDIYLLDLGSGGITRLTDTLEYDGAPAWSPDSKWLVYETYVENNLELKIHSINTPGEIILLTNNPAADFSPAWSPQGRQIAFVSNRSSEDEIWLADLDKSEDQRFQNISLNPVNQDTHPAWSPDGSMLVWVSEKDGLHNLTLNEFTPIDGAGTPAAVQTRRILGSGDWPVWSADGEVILTTLQAPNQTYLTAYRARYPGLVLPALELPGPLNGLCWGITSISSPLQTVYEQAAQATPTALFIAELTSLPEDNGERYQLSELSGVKAPHPYLHDAIDESFNALRNNISNAAGWDFLASLENAYVPLTSPLDPGRGNDWLYTGRAIALNTMPIDAGWMVITREDFGSETYWRVYIRALYQDGSAGVPLHARPWDFDSRHNGSTIYYEKGGTMYAAIPPGYWIDFTAKAHAYGWERLPALSTWRASYPAARFNEFAWMDSLDWYSAMLELYPPESMITPSPVVPPTRTPTPTSRWYVSPTPTTTPTYRPTLTPLPPISTGAPGG